MNNNHYSSLAMANVDLICYMSDPVNYSLYYMNEAGKTLTGYTDDSYKGKLCYEVLQGKKAPCEFCTNAQLTEGVWLEWVFHNENLGVYVEIKDTFIKDKDGRTLRLEFARDVTAEKKEMDSLALKLEMERLIAACLQIFQFETDIDKAIKIFLEKIGTYYGAKRAYTFDIDYEKNILINTYEWCSHCTTSEIDSLQDIPLDFAADWIYHFERDGEYVIQDLEKDVHPNSATYEILKAQDITSLLTIPLIKNGKAISFIGVDNPTLHADSLDLLRAVAFFVYEETQKRFNMNQLEFLSYMDTLTGVFNRNKYISELKKIQNNGAKNIGVCFVDINGLKLANDTNGHEYGDMLIKNSANLLKEVFDHKGIFRVGGAEFVVICANIDKDEFDQKVDTLKTNAKKIDTVNISIGHNWSDGQMDIQKQIIQADALMYNDKQNYYRSIAPSKQNFSVTAKEQLFSDIASGKIAVLLEPIIDLKTGKTVAAQCVVERHDPPHAPLSLNQLVDLYEEEGIMVELDNHILQTVIGQYNTLHKNDIEIRISVQLSSISLSQDGCADKIATMCDEMGMPRNMLTINIKSDFCKLDAPVLQGILASFEKNGISISLDDFGRDNANVETLLLHDFHTVKLAGNLIASATQRPSSLQVVKALVALCKTLPNVCILAKSVDSPEVYSILHSLECDLAKGMYFSDPLALDNFIRFATSNS